MANNLEKSILSTIAYFDIFDYPLTDLEIWKWLYRTENWDKQNVFSEIIKILENSEYLKSLIESKRGFYFLKGRESILKIRQKRYNLAEEKFKKAIKISRFLRFLPGVRMIAVCNSLAWSNASEESDIDFFIVTRKNKIWITRFWAAGFLKLLGLRPRGQRTKDKICLSFFADEDSLDFEKISLGKPDIYLIYWIVQIAPIYDAGGIYQKFLSANSWIKKYLPNYFAAEIGFRRKIKAAALPLFFFGWGNKFSRWLQIKFLPKQIRDAANKDSCVIVSDSILKFHVNDRRTKYREIWENKLKE